MFRDLRATQPHTNADRNQHPDGNRDAYALEHANVDADRNSYSDQHTHAHTDPDGHANRNADRYPNRNPNLCGSGSVL